MSPTKRIHVTLSSVVAAAVLAGMVLLAGCGKSQIESSGPVSSSTSTPKIPATGPAISSNLTFDQLAFESPVKRVRTKNGLVFLEFAYADNDGKVYRCQLPEAMSKGEYPPEEWIRIFNLYRLPQIIAHKRVVKKGSQAIGDFPFISPRPQRVQQPSQPATTSQPTQVPALPPPPMPAQTQPQPMNPRAVPSAAPRPFMPEPGT